MSEPWSIEEINEYDRLFKTCQNFVGQKIEEINFYLNGDVVDFTEQENIYGKSLFNAIELKISGEIFCIGNLFFDKNYNGLNVLRGQTIDFENVDEDKKATSYPSEIIGKQIIKTAIYWTKSHWGNYFVPQEIELRSTTNLFLCSAMEINNGEANTPLTDELLIVENDFCLEKFKLGEYGVAENYRYFFNTLEELMKNEKNIR